MPRDSPAPPSLKHELRTPLNHIIGFCEMLIEEAVDETGAAKIDLVPDLQRIHGAGRRLLGVINDLFDESIPESERLEESEESYLAALDKSTGDVAWKVVRSDGSGMASAWASPYLWRYSMDGVAHTEIVAPGAKRALGYSPQGELLWSFDGFSQVPTPTPFAEDGVLFLSSGSPSEAIRPLLAVRAGARGDISLAEGERSNDSVAWYQPKGGAYIPSPVLWKDRLYVIYDKGIMAAFDTESGEEVWKARIGGGGHTFSSSPWVYDGKIFALSEEGRTFVLEAGDRYRELHSNDLDELTLATPAAAYDSLFLRTERHLYRLSAPRR